MSDPIDWSLTTWEGNRRRQHAEFRALPFREKILMIEQMGDVSAIFGSPRTTHDSESSSSHSAAAIGRHAGDRDPHR